MKLQECEEAGKKGKKKQKKLTKSRLQQEKNGRGKRKNIPTKLIAYGNMHFVRVIG